VSVMLNTVPQSSWISWRQPHPCLSATARQALFLQVFNQAKISKSPLGYTLKENPHTHSHFGRSHSKFGLDPPLIVVHNANGDVIKPCDVLDGS
jgi:hypothetical protein